MGVGRRCREGVNGLLRGRARALAAGGRLRSWSRWGERAGSSHGRACPSTGTSSWGRSSGRRAKRWYSFRDVTGKPGTVSRDEDQLFPKAAATLRRKEKNGEREIEGPSAGPRAASERHTCVPGREAAAGAPSNRRCRGPRRQLNARVVRVSGLARPRPAMAPHLRMRGHPDQGHERPSRPTREWIEAIYSRSPA